MTYVSAAIEKQKSKDLVVAVQSEAQFLSLKDEWQSLLSRSDADPLFMSWHWLSNWWQCYRSPHAELLLITCRYRGKLVAIAPLYLEPDAYFKGVLPLRRVQFLGTRFQGSAGIRCEYCSIIVDQHYESEAVLAIVKQLKHHSRWCELSLSDVTLSSSANRQLVSELNVFCKYHREERAGLTYKVETTGCFSEFIAGLGKNTRLKLFNRRKLLASMGGVTCQRLYPETVPDVLHQLNVFHVQRWGQQAFSCDRLAFFNRLIASTPGDILRHSSILCLNGQPLSIMINLTMKHCVYNIQLGFVENFDKRISLGTLHLGYALEQAFDDPDIQTFDFLEGQGKHANYKDRIAKASTMLQSTRWFRNPLLSTLFSAYDRFLRA